ncbi:tetratricopeptide repeat protein [Novosphingobium album (ex Hu et al. 2023)]|uniref:SPOR domain-containing protein n=1 Tax=Novosphingobium album (ex Hu et al. 2023) TaxID=2930093 RepID=A0ABT0AWT1_9SPHN|nr:tetratricopeptide repeat protein [Novosphingobium album (ex Hu et al. 2023)]MCJ2177296.1 SPOR domain-containing protein [Novosphingobium album (ex Hu et al. 2023)]
MQRSNTHTRTAGFAVCTAMAAALLVGCSGHAPLASSGAPAASGESAGSETDKAIAAAEKRVAKSPRDASDRVALAQAYLAAGRFESAATTFEDAVSLGEDSPRIGLGLALAYAGSGRDAEALTTLTRWRNEIPASDLGLALALAGRPEQAVGLLSDALRSGDDTPKTRQNLAYAYALGGHWTQARIIASQDVPADQLDARLQDWSRRARPEQFQARVAGLLGAPVRADAGQPAALALNAPQADGQDKARMALAQPAAPQPVPAAELPPVVAAPPETAAPAGNEPGTFAAAFAPPVQSGPAPLATSAAPAAPKSASTKFVSQPMVQPLGTERSAYVAGGTHLVQLGSFRTLEGAERAWGIFVARNPALKDHTMRITEAEVRGQRFFRVAAEGFDRGGARTLCSTVRDRGHGCFAYASTRTLPGALPDKVQSPAKLASL